jgi:hypothetical protein
MNSKTGRRLLDNAKASSAIAGTEDFKFEQWASQVRYQMLAVLKKTNKSNSHTQLLNIK